MPNLGVPELLILLVIVAMLFGVGKLPQVFGAVGKGIREFRRESTDNDAEVDELHKAAALTAAPPAAPPAAPSAAAPQATSVAPTTVAPSPEVQAAQPAQAQPAGELVK